MDQSLDTKVTAWLAEHRTGMIADLQRLVRIASYKGEPAPGAPFGPGPLACMKEALILCEEAGMKTANVDGYCGYAQWGDGAEHVAALSHMDTVPIGDGWIHDPLGGACEDGILYGRGASDDKGGAVASLYAVRALMAAGFKPAMPIRLIFGCDEECGMGDMPHYLEKEKAPKYAFSPDAGFPLFYAEKGRIEGFVSCEITGDTAIVSLESGSAANVVPADAEARLRGIPVSVLPASEYITFKEEDGMTYIRAAGISCHGGAPQGGRNAASLLLCYLAKILPETDAAKLPLTRWAELIGMRLDGSGLGVDCADEISGMLTMNIGILRGDTNGISFVFDIRHPVALDVEETASELEKVFEKNGWILKDPSVTKPLYVPLDSPLITTLMDVYQSVTGDMTPPQTMGGGTYAKTLPCAVSYGHTFAGDNTRGHTYEENVNIDHLLKAARIFALALARLSYLDE